MKTKGMQGDRYAKMNREEKRRHLLKKAGTVAQHKFSAAGNPRKAKPVTLPKVMK